MRGVQAKAFLTVGAEVARILVTMINRMVSNAQLLLCHLNPQPFWIVSASGLIGTGLILSFLALDSVAGGWSLAYLLHFILGLWSILKAYSVVNSLAFTYTGTVLGCLAFFPAEPLTFVFYFLDLDDFSTSTNMSSSSCSSLLQGLFSD